MEKIVTILLNFTNPAGLITQTIIQILIVEIQKDNFSAKVSHIKLLTGKQFLNNNNLFTFTPTKTTNNE